VLVRRFMGIDAEDRDPARGQLVQRRAADRTETDDDDICRALHALSVTSPRPPSERTGFPARRRARRPAKDMARRYRMR
jgi:hypothetical protein